MNKAWGSHAVTSEELATSPIGQLNIMSLGYTWLLDTLVVAASALPLLARVQMAVGLAVGPAVVAPSPDCGREVVVGEDPVCDLRATCAEVVSGLPGVRCTCDSEGLFELAVQDHPGEGL